MRARSPHAPPAPLPGVGLCLSSLAMCWLFALVLHCPRARAQSLPSAANTSIADDQQALVDLFVSTGGRASNATAGWRKSTRWLTLNATHPQLSVCSWHGVQCGPPDCLRPANATWAPPSCRVVSLTLSLNNLVGTLAPSFDCLDALQHLDLYRNQISGDIPSLRHWSTLRTLDLSNNRFTRLPPESIAYATALSKLDMSNNRISGNLAAASYLGRLPALAFFSVRNNFLTGPFPEWLLNVSSTLRKLILGANALSGTLPAWVGQFPSLEELETSTNSFHGTIPSSVGDLGNLTKLFLSSNTNMSGTVPPSVGRLLALKDLSLAAMNLSGTIPAAIENLTNLQSLTLFSNAFSGTLPRIDRMPRMQRMFLHLNRFEGTIHDMFKGKSELLSIRLDVNRLTGGLPDSVGDLSAVSVFNVSFNSLTGPLPAALGNLASLSELDMSFNQIDGALPDTMRGLSNLWSLVVRKNRLGPSLPSWLGELTALVEFRAGSNQFAGSVPRGWCSVASVLATVELDNNQLTKFDEADLFACSGLSKLDMSHNALRQRFDLSGAPRVPPFLNLSHNQLGPTLAEYTLPQSLFVASVIDIRHNAYACPYPSNYPTSVIILFSPCAQPWTLLLTYFGILVATFAVMALAVMIALRFVSAAVACAKQLQTQLALFAVSWALEVSDLVLAALTLRLIVDYLSASTDHCAGINRFAYFGALTSAGVYYNQAQCNAARDIDYFRPSNTFAEYHTACLTYGGSTFDDSYYGQFRQLCRATLPQCDFDAGALACRTFYPALDADARGAVHGVFLGLVWAVAGLRLAVELVRAGCVLVAYRRMAHLAVPAVINRPGCLCCGCGCGGGAITDGRSDSSSASGTTSGSTSGSTSSSVATFKLYWMAELVGSSLLSPLLYFGSRAEFVVLHLQREPAPADFVFRAVNKGLLTSMPLLAVHVWYVLRVAQYGMAPAGWLSLVNGVVLIPSLLLRAAQAMRTGATKHQRTGAAEVAAGMLESGIEMMKI